MAMRQVQFLAKKLFSSSVCTRNGLEHLKERSIIQVKGPDVSEFLQGLITNDINHLRDGIGSMFCMFLNTKGRILYDALIYKTEEKDLYLIECDSRVNSALMKHLKIYKIKRKVDILSLDNHKIHVLYNTSAIGRQSLEDDNMQVLDGHYDKKMLPENSSDLKMFDNLLIYRDPRVAQLGFRILSESTENIQNTLTRLVECNTSTSYKQLKYTLGIGEGTEDLLVGNSFPLECNCDYLHGVSFHKGCYIGQELTARSHHTGVIRKRLMPLYFSKVPSTLPENNVISHENKNLGKLRGIDGNVGLALLRINQTLGFGTITVGNGEATVAKPYWWPIELPKEKLNVHSTT